MKSHWIAGAIHKKGALHKMMHIPAGQRIPVAKLTAAAHMKGVEGRRARLALTLRKMHK